AGHQRVGTAAGPIVVQLLIDRSSRLPVETRIVRYDRYPLLAVAGDAHFQHLSAPAFGIAERENLQNFRRPDDLRDRSWRRDGRGLRLGRRAWQDSERTADSGIGIEPGTAALHDRNDQNPQQPSEQQDAEHRDARPYPPGLIENVRLGDARIGHDGTTYWMRCTMAVGEGSIANWASGQP